MSINEYEWVIDLNCDIAEFSVETKKFTDIDGKSKIKIKATVVNKTTKPRKAMITEMNTVQPPCNTLQDWKKGENIVVTTIPATLHYVKTKRELIIKILSSTGRNSIYTLFPPIETYVESQEHPPKILRRIRALKAEPEQSSESLQAEEQIIKPIEAVKAPSETSLFERMQIRNWVEEIGFEVKFKEKYLQLRKLYTQYQVNNKSIEKCTREKKEYSGYTKEGRYQKWYINKNYIRPLQQQQEEIYERYRAIKEEFPNDAKNYYRLVP